MTSAEKNTRKKIRISIIDVLIVLTVIGGIAGTFLHYKIYEEKNRVVTDDSAVVSVLLSSQEAEVENKIKVGDKLYFKDSEFFGTVVEVSFENADVTYTDANGKLVLASDDRLRDVTLLVAVDGEFTPSGFLARGTDYTAAGAEIEVFSLNFSGNGLIFDVKKQTE